MSSSWFVYLVKCADDTLYTGVTNDLTRRIKQHNGQLSGGARYTASRRPVVLVWIEEVETRSMAQKRESEVRRLSRQRKIKLTLKKEMAQDILMLKGLRRIL